MDRNRHKLQQLRRVIMEDDDSSRRPKFSTSTSGWISGNSETTGDLNLVHGFLGIRFKVPRESIKNIKPPAVKLRINNKSMYEPFLEGNDHRVYDIIQVCPKEFIFVPPAEITVRLPSCVNRKSAGQVVCMFSNTFALRNDTRYLQWGRIDSELFIINPLRTEAKIICKYSGYYTLILTQCPETTSKVSPKQRLTISLQDYPGIKITYDAGCVDLDKKITLKVVCLEDLYNSPSPSPTFNKSRRRPIPIQIRGNASDDMIDVTGSPVVLVRPIRTRFRKPVKLSLPLLGDELNGFFEQASSRLVVLKSTELEEESIIWHHHYSTPEIETTTSGKKIATFLIISGGLFKVVRRFPNKHMRFVEQVSNRISRELCITTSPDVMVTSLLKGFITEIAEPGKQFVLRISLLDSSQPNNPDSCFIFGVCSQPLTVALGKVRFLVRGRFEPDRDAADHSEERTVMFTGKTTFVDFNLKLRLSDSTKLPETIGKVTIHSSSEMQYYITLQKPTPIPKEEVQCKRERDIRRTRHLRQKKQLIRRHNTSISHFKMADPCKESAIKKLNAKETCQVSSSFTAMSELAAIGDDDEEDIIKSTSGQSSYTSYTPISNRSSSLLSKEDSVLVSNGSRNNGDPKSESSSSHKSNRSGSSNRQRNDSFKKNSNVGRSSSSKSCQYEIQSSLRRESVDEQEEENNASDWSTSDDVRDENIGQRSEEAGVESLVTKDNNVSNEDDDAQKQNQQRENSKVYENIEKDVNSYSSFESTDSGDNSNRESQDQDKIDSRKPSYSTLTSDSISIDSQI